MFDTVLVVGIWRSVGCIGGDLGAGKVPVPGYGTEAVAYIPPCDPQYCVEYWVWEESGRPSPGRPVPASVTKLGGEAVVDVVLERNESIVSRLRRTASR